MKLLIKYLEIKLKWLLILHRIMFGIDGMHTDKEMKFRYGKIYPLQNFIELLKRKFKNM